MDTVHPSSAVARIEHPRVIVLERPPVIYPAVKRALDAVLAAALLILLAPVLAVCALAVLLETGRPILFRQERVGQGGRRFTMLKFRSMRTGADSAPHREYMEAYIAGVPAPQPTQPAQPAQPAQSAQAQDSQAQDPGVAAGAVYKIVTDARVTRVGRWLRRTSLDELPQLWNVLVGEMSLVGPRPPIPYEVELYRPYHRRRLAAKPGITGAWQVRGRSRTTFEEMVAMDLDYIGRRSLLVDLEIMARTVPAVLLRKGAH